MAIPPNDLLDFAAGLADKHAVARLQRQLRDPKSELSLQLESSKQQQVHHSDEDLDETDYGEEIDEAGEVSARTSRARPQSERHTRRSRKIGLLILAMVTFTGASFAAWGVFFAPKSLVDENFNNGSLDARVWNKKLCRRQVMIVDEYLRLNNRGSVVTMKEFRAPIEINFDWRWIDRDQDPHNTDILKVVLHSSGKHTLNRPYEIPDEHVSAQPDLARLPW